MPQHICVQIKLSGHNHNDVCDNALGKGWTGPNGCSRKTDVLNASMCAYNHIQVTDICYVSDSINK